MITEGEIDDHGHMGRTCTHVCIHITHQVQHSLPVSFVRFLSHTPFPRASFNISLQLTAKQSRHTELCILIS